MVDRLRSFITNIGQRMAEMPPSARLLVGSIAIIVAMGLFLVAQYAAGPQMASLTVDAEFQAVALQRIKEAGYDAEKGTDGSLNVPQRDKRKIERLLAENEIPTSGASQDASLATSGFKSDNVFRAELRQIRVSKAEQTIRGVDGIVEARILLSETERRGFGRDRAVPKATATIRVRGGEVDRGLAQSVAVITASVDADLGLDRVQVIDAVNGRSFSFSEDESGTDGDYLADVRSIARDLKTRVYNLLSMSYPSVRVEANAQVLRARSEMEVWEIGKPQSTEIFERTEEESKPLISNSANRPGFASNSGTSGLNTPVGPIGASPVATRDRQERELRAGFPGSVERTQSANGHPMQLDLAIVIPEAEFMATIAESNAEEGSSVDPALVKEEMDLKKQMIRALVAPLIDTTALRGGQLGTVEIAILPSAVEFDVAGGGAISDSMQLVMGDGGETIKNAGLVVLSLLGLAVMFMMVRRSTGPGVSATEEELRGSPPPLEAEGADVLGEADEASPALVGVELDDEALRRRQMLEQLNQLVESEPTAVAGLIRRWMRTDS